MTYIQILDYWTQYSLDAIWNEWVNECININNIEELINKTNAKEFHLTAQSFVESGMQYRKDGIYMGGLKEIPEFQRKVSNAEIIKEFRNGLL